MPEPIRPTDLIEANPREGGHWWLFRKGDCQPVAVVCVSAGDCVEQAEVAHHLVSLWNAAAKGDRDGK